MEQNLTLLSTLKGTFSLLVFAVQNAIEKIYFFLVSYLLLEKVEEQVINLFCYFLLMCFDISLIKNFISLF